MGYRAVTVEQWERDLIADGIPSVVDLPQAAAILRCSRSTVVSYRDADRLSPIWPKGSWRPIQFARRELCRFLAEGG